jgi:two-component system response regulator TctD
VIIIAGSVGSLPVTPVFGQDTRPSSFQTPFIRPMRLLLVEDHDDLAEWLTKLLRMSGYAVDWVADGKQADAALLTQAYDLVVLDLSLPGMDGLEVLRRARQRGNTVPVLILTARGATEDKVRGFSLGADDYLAKPFEVAELEARLKALLRRGAGHLPVLHLGNLTFDTGSRMASVGGQALALTPRELAVLEGLLTRVSRPISREALFEKVFNYEEAVRAEAIEIYVHRLRKKLEGSGATIRTMRGLGYLIEAAAQPDSEIS